MTNRRKRGTFKKLLSIAMAAAVMTTSVPQMNLSVDARELEESAVDDKSAETKEEQAAEKDSAVPAQNGGETDMEESLETEESEAESDGTETSGEKETVKADASEAEQEDSGETKSAAEEETENTEETESRTETEKESETETKKETVDDKDVKEGDNKALRFQMKTAAGEWTDSIQQDINVPDDLTFDVNLKADYQVSYDLYLPKDAEFTGNYYVKTVTKLGSEWKWTDGDGSNVARADFEACEESDALVKYTFKAAIGEDAAEYNVLKAVVIAVGSSECSYDGVMFVDNVMLLDEDSNALMKEDFSSNTDAVVLGSMDGITEGGGDQEEQDGSIVYKENFDSWTSLDGMETDDELEAVLGELAAGNKAIQYFVDLSASSSWTDIFKTSLKLTKEYSEPITDKLNMTFDVYIPEESITEDFGTMKAQAALKVGSDWTWITQKSWPQFTAENLVEDENVSGFKKYTFSIDMNDFQTWDNDKGNNVAWDFADVTPIQTVIPCLAGDTSAYKGDIYLDNVVVTAYNKKEDDVVEERDDLILSLDKANWSDGGEYQYKGTKDIKNESLDGKTMLAVAFDYTEDIGTGWSEAKLNYTHPSEMGSLRGYNAFQTDVYYKPENMTAGSFKIKIYKDTGEEPNKVEVLNKDGELPEGTAVEGIEGLEGYYKSTFTLEINPPDASIDGFTLGMVGCNTDYQGDIYFDNMKFAQVKQADNYVDSTISPKKGKGITVSEDGRTLTTASGKEVTIAENVALVDAKAVDATKNLYAYLKAVGESDSVIFGHQNDTHHKAGAVGEDFSESDTKDVTGSIAGVIGIDTLSLTGNEAGSIGAEWDAPQSQRIAVIADLTRAAAAEGALITLSAHMPNFDVIDQRVKAFEEGGKTADKSDTLGYWEDENGTKTYNFSGYTPGTVTGNVVARIMPGQDLNYLYTAYLDMIADYAKAVEDDGITILFRPLHENTGSWFWWGAAQCDEQSYINLYRYTVDYLKETKNVHNMLYVYGPGSEAENVAEYEARYPGDAYVDMVGYDMYHQVPSQENEAAYLANISMQNHILKSFSEKHGKLYAITETGVANGDKALLRTENGVMDWYMQLLEQISKDGGISYFLVWANFDDNGSFYTPYVVKKNADGTLHGHEMLDEFIKFYNDDRSAFATDLNNEFKKIQGVANTTEKDTVSGYVTAPISGSRILAATKFQARISGIDAKADVKFIIQADQEEVELAAAYNNKDAVWEADLTAEDLERAGKGLGSILLAVNGEVINQINAIFNEEEPEADPMVPEDFESYSGSDRLLNGTWAANKDTGSRVTLKLTNEEDKVFGGKYALQMEFNLASATAWAGATKNLSGTSWAAGNALTFYTIPEANGQKTVVQVTSAGNVFEVYMQEYENYTEYGKQNTPVKVIIPFSAFVGRDNKNAAFDPESIDSIGLWCNAVVGEGIEFPLSTAIVYDEFRIVTTDVETITLTKYEPPVIEEQDGLVLSMDKANWSDGGAWEYSGSKEIDNIEVGGKKMLSVGFDYSDDKDKGWSEAKLNYTHPSTIESLKDYNMFQVDVYYKPENMTAGSFKIKIFKDTGEEPNKVEVLNKDGELPEGTAVEGIEGLEGYYKATFTLAIRPEDAAIDGLTFGLVGCNTDYKGNIYFDNMKFVQIEEKDDYVDSTIAVKKGAGITVSEDGRTLTTAGGDSVSIAEYVELVDTKAVDATKNLYAYLKAVGESDSVIFGHQNDTHHKAGAKTDGLTESDTKDVTGSIAGVVGIDTLSLTGNEAGGIGAEWDVPQSQRIAVVADLTRKAAAEGALITLSAHMPNFDLIDQRVKAFEANGGTTSDTVGYWETENEDGTKTRTYNFSGYTPGTVTGNVVARIMPGQDLNYLYTAYLDMIAEYAKAVEEDGITILFRPLHENTGSWFWWGAAQCDEQSYISLYRYTVDYLKETKGVHNMLYVYGPGSEAENTAEYAARYPGDAYVDMIGYDMYHQTPSQENEAAYLANISMQNSILKSFAEAHGKLYAITETGVANGDKALLRSGNEVMDWYMQLLDQISRDGGVSYFLVWANFDDNGSFYTPYVVKKNEDGSLHGHEMLDEFIKFYNDDRSAFAADLNNEFKKIQGVTNKTEKEEASGYIIAPISGSRILTETMLQARISDIDTGADVEFIAAANEDTAYMQAEYNEENGLWEAVLTLDNLFPLGTGLGTISLQVKGRTVAQINVMFNEKEPIADPMVPEDFESYGGSDRVLNNVWATNKDTGSSIGFGLTNEASKVFGGNYALQMDFSLASSTAWAGATKNLSGVSWADGNAIEFYTMPEINKQKVVVQVTSAGNVFEVYMQEYENYTECGRQNIPVKVTIPFSAFVGRDNKEAVFNPEVIDSIGLWCNAVANDEVQFPLSTTIYYDEFKIVTSQAAEVTLEQQESREPVVTEGIYVAKPASVEYTGKAIKPAVKVTDGTTVLKLNKDYTVKYQNNINAGTAKAVVKGKGSYKDKINNTVEFRILQKPIRKLTITTPEYLAHTGKEQKVAIKVQDDKKTLKAGKDYTFKMTYAGGEVVKAKDKGEYTITIAPMGNYGGDEREVTLYVGDKTAFGTKTIRLENFAAKKEYTGRAQYQNLTVYDKNGTGKNTDDVKLVKNKDYTVTYIRNMNAGKATVIISGKGKYAGRITKTFTISKVKLKNNVTVSDEAISIEQSKAGAKPDVTVTYKGMTLVNGVDYTLTYTNNKQITAGTKKAAINVKGIGNYQGTLSKAAYFTITPKSLQSEDIEVVIPDVKYSQSKKEYKPTVTVLDNGAKLARNKDYTIEYKGNANLTLDENGEATAQAVITAKSGGSYDTGDPDRNTITVNFKIKR